MELCVALLSRNCSLREFICRYYNNGVWKWSVKVWREVHFRRRRWWKCIWYVQTVWVRW